MALDKTNHLAEKEVVNLGGCWKQMISGTNHDAMDGDYLYLSEIVAKDEIQLALATVNIDCDQFEGYEVNGFGLDNICLSLRDGHFDQIKSAKKTDYTMSVIKMTRNPPSIDVASTRGRGSHGRR